MYDVNFGGIEQMTKRLSIALVAVALFVLLAVMPVSAITQTSLNGNAIDAGATVFIGEQGLNLTHAMNEVYYGAVAPQANGTFEDGPLATKIGWWASAAVVGTTAPTKSLDIGPQVGGRYLNFQVAPADFVGYTGNWYLLGPDGQTPYPNVPAGTYNALFNVQDPTLSVGVWDWQQQKDVTGLSIPQGENLAVQVNTNMYVVTFGSRNNTLWEVGPLAPYAALGTGTGPALWPNSNSAVGAASAWSDYNWTGVQNGSYVAAQNANNVWEIRNYQNVTDPAFGNEAVFGVFGQTLPINTGYDVLYFNNSAVVGSGDGPFGGTSINWTAQNFTRDDQGLVPFYPSVAGFKDWNHVGMAGTSYNAVPMTLLAPNAATDGYITLKVKDESGAVLDHLMVGVQGGPYASTGITKQFVNNQPWYFGSAAAYWVTDAVDANSQYIYPVGTYSVWAESLLNNMKDNYKNAGSDYTGKTISATGTVTLISNSVKIEANKDSVVRSKSFSVTVTGKPSQSYYLWVKGTSAMTSGYDDQPPMMMDGQAGVVFDNSILASGIDPVTNLPVAAGTVTHPYGQYLYENGAGNAIFQDVGQSTIPTYNQTRYYANITLSNTGTRTIEFITTNWTKAQKYTIRVEQDFKPLGGHDYKSDEVDVNVEKGAVTIVAAGDQSYYLGEEIKFSGTNTETYKTYLFIVGPNLKEKGSQIAPADLDPRQHEVANGDASTFKAIDVNGDNTWSWKWGTANYALDAGTYTIYAVSQPNDKDDLGQAAYGTVSVIIKKPFVSATASQSTVAKGDRIYVTGTAEGDPNSVQIWIMGKNYADLETASVNSDASFSYEIKQETTKLLSSGQYFVVVQHPMQNKVFDVDLVGQYVVNKQLQTQGTTNYTRIFKLLGSGSLQGSDAAEALAQGINDANVDDTYTKLQFLIEEPIIRVDAIGDKHVGDKFTITAQTNLAVDDEVLVQVYSSSFKPTEKSQSGEFSGATGTIKVTKGDSGMNKLSFDVDSSTFKPDEYIVTEDAVIQVATGTALFNVLETSAQTVAPTEVVTAAPTNVATAVPTTVATAAPTATPTKSPGFGALIALIGLGAVAFVVVRRH
jgi:PGF-CTERM protein